MPSKTDIANFALEKISQPVIDSIENTSDINAKRCKRHFDQAVKEVGQRIPWGCLTKWADLTASGTPPFKWGYGYALPANFLRVNQFNRLDVYEQFSDYFQTDDRYLYTDADTAQIEYNEFHTDTGRYTPLFVEAVACKLALKIAPSILGSGGDMPALTNMYDIAIGQASQVEGNQSHSKITINNVIQGSRLIKSRRFSTNG